MIDIDELESSAAATFDVVVQGKATKQPSGFRVMGSSSAQYQTAKREREIVDIKAFAATKSRPDIATDEGATLAANNADELQMLILRRCVVGWFGFRSKAAEVPFSVEALARVLKAKPNWVALLISEIETDANFTKA